MGGVRFPLPARDRIILHLSDFNLSPTEEGSFPPSLTQDGIAFRTGLGRAHVALALKSLREEGLVDEIKGRVAGEARRRKVYALSEPGRAHGKNILTAIMDLEVTVRAEGSEEKRTKLSGASFVLPRKVPLIDLALAVGEDGLLLIGANGLPVGQSEEEEATMDGPGEGAGEQPSSDGAGPSGQMPDVDHPPSPATAFMAEGPASGETGGPGGGARRPELEAGAGMQTSGAAVPVPGPRYPAPPPSVWAQRGQLAAVWAGAVVLAGVVTWLGDLLDEPVAAELLAVYFLMMVSLQAVLIGLKKIPVNVRAEMGLFLGIFLSLYGGFMGLGPPFPSLLWFTEGILLLSTGLLLHPLDTERKFQTAAAGTGAFIIMLALQWAAIAYNMFQVLFLIPWMLVGGLFLTARIYPGLAGFTAAIRTAAGLASGCFMMTIGGFLVMKGLTVESFVEFLVGAVIIYYMAPKKRQEWSGMMAACTVILCIMVVITTFIVLLAFLGNLSYFRVK